MKGAFRAAYPNDPNAGEISTADLLEDHPAVRYHSPAGDLCFNVIARLGEIASFDTVEAQTIELAGIRAHVATPAALQRLRNLMPVQRFRSIEEMNAAPILVSPGDGFDRESP